MEQKPKDSELPERGLPRLLSAVMNNPRVSDIEILAQKRGVNKVDERFKVVPDYAYPHTKMNREELRREMNKKSSFYHQLRLPSEPQGVGQVSLEIMQCFGLPKPDSKLGSEASAFCVAVCGAHAFRTDTMPPVANPMWLSRMRRACIFPIFHAYARVYVGVFGNSETKRDGFAGRIVVDIARLRPGCTYDITLPLRRSAHVYSREQRGAIRVRIHLHWYSERKAILSYLPRKVPKIAPNDQVTVNCCDVKSFQNVARVVHGEHMPGRFNTKQLKATIREISLTQINLLRYMRKREFRNLVQWRVPLISAFLFVSWMHCVYTQSVTYIPGHFVTILLLYLWKNYAFYRLDVVMQNGFIAPTWEEMFLALLFGRPDTIAPLQMEANAANIRSAIDDMNAAVAGDETMSVDDLVSHIAIKKIFRAEMKLRTERRRLRLFHHVFTGAEAVDFLLARGYAENREEAVGLGEILRLEQGFFEHVSVSRHPFKDDNSLYHFVDGTPDKYNIKTHLPWGKGLFRLLRLMPHYPPDFAAGQMEMPYTDGVGHPRLTVKESLVIRSKESMKMLEDEHNESDHSGQNEKSNSQQLAEGLDQFLNNDDDKDETSKTTESIADLDGNPDIEVKMLPKPPQQDIEFSPPKSGKHITEIMAEARYRLHGYMMHSFNDHVYPGAMLGSRAFESSRRKVGNRLKGKISKLKMFRKRDKSSASSLSADSIKEDPQFNPKEAKDHLDKLLGIGNYSHANPWIARVGVIVQPIMEMMLQFLCFFRAIFNIFTWRDPILTFWVSLIGPVAVIIMHCFPYRIFVGIVGIALFGPQNWIIRLYREYKYGPDDFDPDRIVKKKKITEEDDEEDVPLFSMDAPDNRPIPNDSIDDSVVRQVVVPYSQLMYQRFYDFPPETEYARVTKEGPPDEYRLDPSQFSRVYSSVSGSQESYDGYERSVRRPFKNMRARRRRRRVDAASSDEEPI